MRFQRVSQDETSSMSARKWRPPDYKSDPKALLLQQAMFQNHGRREQSKRIVDEVQVVKKDTLRKHEESPQSMSSSKYPVSRWVKNRQDRRLPLPYTHSQIPHRQRRVSYYQRILALSISILLTMSLLGAFVTMLSAQLESVASKVEAQNKAMKHAAKIVHDGREDAPPTTREHHRKLAMASGPGQGNTGYWKVPSSYIRGFALDIYRSILTLNRLLSALSQAKKNSISVSLLHQSEYPLKFALSLPSVKVSSAHLSPQERLTNLQRQLRALYEDLLHGNVKVPIQVPRTDAASFVTSPPQSDLFGKGQRTLPKIQNYHTPKSAPIQKDIGQRRASDWKALHILHSGALNVVGGASRDNPFRDPKHNTSIRPSGNRDQAPSRGSKRQESVQSQQQQYISAVNENMPSRTQYRPSVANAIEVWELPNAKSLCRIFGAGRLSDGTVVLPIWMKAHAEFLLTRCGIRGALYAIEAETTTGLERLQVDRNILKATIKTDFVIDQDRADADLFGLTAPRNHMPHFVSDILLPLVASEVLLGSGYGFLKYSVITPSSRERLARPPVSAPPDIKPALLIFEETLKRPSTEWVPRLVKFFQHPKLGFKLVPAGKERPGKQEVEGEKRLLLFRSVVTSNLNIHEPHGLFGTNGKNVVFAVNGISRDPPWTMPGMNEKPCRIQATILTRKGPRALLKLGDLERMVRGLANSEGLRVEFRVVDFGELPFNEQVKTMQDTNVLIATHGAGNANFIFMRPSAAVIEVFPFSYKAGPFNSFARIFGLGYSSAMSAPQTDVFKECMNRHERNDYIKKLAFSRWDKAVDEERKSPWVHRLDFEKEFGEPGKSQGMTTRGCVRMQELEFDIGAVSRLVIESGRAQCSARKYR